MKKLLQFHEKIGAITKDSKNPFFKSNYFDINKLIEEVKPILQELQLVITQPLEVIDGKTVLATYLIDTESDNEYLLRSAIILPEIQDPQKIGGAITYYRRYALQSMLFLRAEDDDANYASNKTEKPQPSEKQIPVEEIPF